ncbi:SRPBCC family protein [Saccharibacillus sp. CPCC 101409]|uniref:SRPBCC family protein n=1 Tax=Saccharibacillus sp. CPCC 101409 TaxID=3058041 RepID=UPI0026734E1C|nr:SRPBCC family protein [Saccharibacillus sp. CPCC 101409]MDO3410862.1 SRPBCC family protein [Saccharibacillus sp. CPCC 101409]
MSEIHEEILIHAPIGVCFDAARDIGLHPRTVWPHTRERALPGGITEGKMELGDRVLFEAVHFGVRQRLLSVVEQMEYPYFFVDTMRRGAFRHMTHRYEFEEKPGGTLVRDILVFASPLGPLGRLFDRLVLKRYMRAFILYRQRELKKAVEALYAAGGHR